MVHLQEKHKLDVVIIMVMLENVKVNGLVEVNVVVIQILVILMKAVVKVMNIVIGILEVLELVNLS